MTAPLVVGRAALWQGDCRDVMAGLPEASVDAIVSDPPYGLGFMGKDWDHGIPGAHFWEAALRVAKPGAHLLAFGGTRTFHRLAVAIEDAGWELRDVVMWVYGSGFPKSLQVDKAIDKRRHDRAEVYEVTAWIAAARDAAGTTNKAIDAAFGFTGMAGHWTSAKSQPQVPTLEQIPTLLAALGVTLEAIPDRIRSLLWELNGRKGQPGPNWLAREVTGQHESAAAGQTWRAGHGFNADLTPKERRDIPATEDAATWEGWGTALKPAWEPVIVARKPFAGSVANNVTTWGTGALNIDACRVDGAKGSGVWGTSNEGCAPSFNASPGQHDYRSAPTPAKEDGDDVGRWPANLMHDGSPEVLAAFPETGPGQVGGVNDPNGAFGYHGGAGGLSLPGVQDAGGSAARFFYCAKASNEDRNEGLEHLTAKREADRRKADGPGGDNPRNRTNKPRQNTHPTVKPTDLMRYLCRLVTPPGGVVLDPFMGSGSTGKAALLEGFQFVGIDLEPEYVAIAEARCQRAQEQGDLFGPPDVPPLVATRPAAVPLNIFDQAEA